VAEELHVRGVSSLKVFLEDIKRWDNIIRADKLKIPHFLLQAIYNRDGKLSYRNYNLMLADLLNFNRILRMISMFSDDGEVADEIAKYSALLELLFFETKMRSWEKFTADSVTKIVHVTEVKHPRGLRTVFLGRRGGEEEE